MYSIAGSIIVYEYAKNESKNAKKAESAAEQEARSIEFNRFPNIAWYAATWPAYLSAYLANVIYINIRPPSDFEQILKRSSLKLLRHN